MGGEKYTKSVIIELQKFFENPKAVFVIDDENDINLFNECINKIRGMDNLSRFFIVTYPQDNQGNIYSDNLLVYTSLEKNILEEIFASHREVEPYYIEKMTEDEKDAAEWIDLTQELVNSAGAQVYSIYWD